MIRYEADGAAVSELLPPHLEPADDPAICTSWARWVPFSAFGPYHEAFVMVDVMLHGTRYMYQPSILVDNDIPLGRGAGDLGLRQEDRCDRATTGAATSCPMASSSSLRWNGRAGSA